MLLSTLHHAITESDKRLQALRTLLTQILMAATFPCRSVSQMQRPAGGFSATRDGGGGAARGGGRAGGRR